MCTCAELKIPDELHRQGRNADPDFKDETIYRRFKAQGNVDDWLQDRQLSALVFPAKQDSCNRDKYSMCPEDVLINTNCDRSFDFYKHYGIVSFNSTILEKFPSPVIVDNKERQFTLRLKHTPEECMYPHCEIFVFENEIEIDRDAPKTTRSLIRTFLIHNIGVYKMPE